MNRFYKMFEKGYIGNCQIKNRVVMPAMTTGFAGLDGEPTEQLMRYYEERAEGGVGLIITEIFRIDSQYGGVAAPRQLDGLNPVHIPSLAQMTTRIHKHGAKIFAQLHHGGSTNYPFLNNGKIYAPSAIPNVSGILPEELTVEQIKSIEQGFIETARNCQLAGFDGVEIHCAHGYLLLEFMSQAFNKREDEYGGSLENRCRMTVEILQGIKDACGKDFPISVRLSAQEYDPYHPDCLKLEDGVEIAKLLEAAGADAINVSCGNYFAGNAACEAYSYEQGWRKENAKAVKEAVRIPVIAVNTIKGPEFAEELLEEGISDYVGIGRGNIADPQWVKKAREDRTSDIRTCIGCLYCFESLVGTGQIYCSSNPRVGRETCFPSEPEKNGDGRRLAVVGGGPAGMQAASVLAKRGFAVTLFEKEAELGGAMTLAGITAPYKKKILNLRDTLAREVHQSGTELRLGNTATVETVAAVKPEAVFLCAGAEPFIPNVPGITDSKVLLANDVISGAKKPSGKVLVIGAGLTGLETAELICHNGLCDSVTVADMLPKIGQSIYLNIFVDIMGQLMPYNPTLLPGHRLTAVTETGAKFLKLDDQTESEVSADYIILAMGLKVNRDVIKAYEDAFPRVVVLGENHKAPGRISVSVENAFTSAFGFDPQL